MGNLHAIFAVIIIILASILFYTEIQIVFQFSPSNILLDNYFTNHKVILTFFNLQID